MMPSSLQPFAKLLIVCGLLLVAIGLLLYFADKIPFIGKLPGDIYLKKKNFTFYFPLVTCLLVSLILSLIFYFFRRS